jgi:hypothetical protein
MIDPEHAGFLPSELKSGGNTGRFAGQCGQARRRGRHGVGIAIDVALSS